jgi:hypothetical protein
MCAEFLRMPEAEQIGLPRLVHLLIPVGRTMKDVVIVGVASNGQMIVCQITYLNAMQSASKIAALEKYVGINRPIFFCNEPHHSEHGGIHIISVSKVFDAFASTALGKMWLAALRPASAERHPS